MEENRAVDVNGAPIPWITYPALDFLAERVLPEMVVFEYGSGNSTFWWSSRVKKLISCEHDKEWYALFRSEIPDNTTYLLRRAKGGSTDYAMEISNYKEMFDILVIDGRDRVNCVKNGLASLRHTGVIIWDNSDRSEYQEGFDLLREKGFKSLDFWGMGALATRRWCTSIYYRRKNCLNI
jgi:predicted O-methyltransferase YrrM